MTRLIALASLLISMALCPLLAQETASLRGVVRDGGSDNGLGGVIVTLQSSRQQTTTESDGSFAFYNIKAGKETILFS
uniref:carboxypeptidase-like regulatory domain-containing protein n=1 Tax=uncultured Porphyromonas sp. TaxID=159274 RepID=UPI0026029FB7